jgi:hypothetical protein
MEMVADKTWIDFVPSECPDNGTLRVAWTSSWTTTTGKSDNRRAHTLIRVHYIHNGR